MIAGILALSGCTDIGKGDGFANVDDQRLLEAAAHPEEWVTYGGTYDEQRYSRLDKINKENVDQLGVAWTYDLKTSRGVESTPIVVDGMMYVTGAWSIVSALDARTGEEKWVYDPKVPKDVNVKGCCDAVNRGVAVYGGKIFVGTFDGRLEALDAKTGKLLWSEVTVDQSKPYTITGAPRVVKGKVLIGNGGAELGVRGYVSAYDADDGKLAWRFYTTPNPKKAADGAASDEIFQQTANKTWGDDGAWTSEGGGGTVWDAIVYDDVNDQILIGVGNGSPWNDELRDPNSDGDNFFLSSIVALDANSGKYKWHFQTTPRDKWDYTATQTIILANLPLGENGASKRVVMQAPKNGYFYVLDAATGKYISGKAYAAQTWTTGLDANGRPIENPAARTISDAGHLNLPGPPGAHNWHPMAFNPDTGLAYIPMQEAAQFIQKQLPGSQGKSGWNVGYNMAAGLPLNLPKGVLAQIQDSYKGMLIAWDPVKQEARWTADLGGPANGGILTTKSGLVFQGTKMGLMRAYDAATGSQLWQMALNSGIASPPVTYMIDGEQYLAVTTGWGGAWALNNGHAWKENVAPDVGRVFVFKLGANGKVPDPLQMAADKSPKGPAFGDAGQIQLGYQRYAENCMVCHGPLVISSGVLPDLRWSHVAADKQLWQQVVIDGSLKAKGMVSFSNHLNPDEAEAIRAYALSQAWDAVANGDAKAPPGK